MPLRGWLGAGLIMLSWPLALAAEAVTFGEQGTGNDAIYDNLNFLTATQFTCPASGAVNRIVFYVPITAGASGRVALYGNGGTNLPGALLAESGSQALVTGWNTFVIPDTAVTLGETYWLANQLSNAAATVGIYNNDPSIWKSRERWPYTYAGFPDPFGSPTGAQAWRFCIYADEVTATFTPTPAVGTATFTPTPSVTASATATFTPTLTVSRTATPSGTPTATSTPTSTRTATFSPTRTITVTGTISPVYTPTSTPTITPTVSISPTGTPLPAVSPTGTPIPAASPSPSMTSTRAGFENPGGLRIYPQPGRDRVHLACGFTGPGVILLEVYNAAGERVLGLRNAFASQVGEAVLELQTRDLAPGIYYVRLQIEDQQGRRLVKGKMAITLK
ncbi:MAG: T9SS type A sorting domain-containing protein [candidate division FCPU426 bacterium]